MQPMRPSSARMRSLLAPLLLADQALAATRLPPEEAMMQKRAESLGLNQTEYWRPNRPGVPYPNKWSVGTDAGTVVIVGANGGSEVGWFGQRGFRVIGVECLPREFARLHVEHMRNPCVNMINGCASSSFGLTTLHLAGDSSSTVHANVKAENGKARQEPVLSIPVPTFKLDPILRSHGDHIAIVMVDVQGAEYGVFQGLQSTIELHRPIILYEYYMDETHRSRKLLEQLGYTCDATITFDMLCWPRPSDAQAAFSRATKLPQCLFQNSRWCPQLACVQGNFKSGVHHPNFG